VSCLWCKKVDSDDSDDSDDRVLIMNAQKQKQFPLWILRYIHSIQHSPRFKSHYKSSHVAMIFSGKRLIAIGQNNKIGHSRNHNTPTVHAEIDAINAIGTKHLRDTILVVIRITSVGLQNSKPCHSCECFLQKCIKIHGMHKIIHS